MRGVSRGWIQEKKKNGGGRVRRGGEGKEMLDFKTLIGSIRWSLAAAMQQLLIGC